jgi:hypothetical protein
MEYGPLAYVRAIWELAVPGKKTMEKKADEVRKALINGASPHKLALAVIKRAKCDYPATWKLAAIFQLAHMLHIAPATARILISEMTTERMH